MAVKPVVRIGLLGLGTVGTGVAKVLMRSKEKLERNVGAKLELARVADKDLARPRDIQLPAEILTDDALKVVHDPSIDLVVELIGGIMPAKLYIMEAIKARKHVVTANKALLAECWDEIVKAARENGVEVYFEAAVGGGIPIIQSISEGLAANRIEAVYMIINGTSNYILTRMDRDGKSFSEALKEAQKKGYAEADPALDIGGGDAAHKLAILSSLAFETTVSLKSIFVEGIQDLTPQDFAYAREEFGYVVKLLAIAKLVGEEGKGEQLEVRVHPTLIPESHLLASVEGAYNGIYVVGDAVGSTMFYGLGAGQMPTASAVVSDILYVARSIAYGVAGRAGWGPFGDIPLQTVSLPVRPIEAVVTRYYMRLTCLDKPGVLAQIAEILGRNQISIAGVVQKERRSGDKVPVIILTYEARERDMQKALKEIHGLDAIKGKTLIIRMEKGE